MKKKRVSTHPIRLISRTGNISAIVYFRKATLHYSSTARVLTKLPGHSVSFLRTQYSVTPHLGRSETLLGQLAHVLSDLLGGDLEPRGRAPLVGERRLGDTLPTAVHAPHLQWSCCSLFAPR